MRLSPTQSLRDPADLRSLSPIAFPRVGLLRVFLYRPPWASDVPDHVIGWDEHLRAAAELETTGHTWRAHASCHLYLSGNTLPI